MFKDIFLLFIGFIIGIIFVVAVEFITGKNIINTTVIKYVYDIDTIKCSEWQEKAILIYPNTYPELKPLQKEILDKASKRGYITINEGRQMEEALYIVQKEYDIRRTKRILSENDLEPIKRKYNLK